MTILPVGAELFHTKRQTDGQADGRTGRRTDRQTDGQTVITKLIIAFCNLRTRLEKGRSSEKPDTLRKNGS